MELCLEFLIVDFGVACRNDDDRPFGGKKRNGLGNVLRAATDFLSGKRYGSGGSGVKLKDAVGKTTAFELRASGFETHG